MAINNECEALVGDRGRWQAKYAGGWLLDKRGYPRWFRSERAAMTAAYEARDGKDNRPAWRRRGAGAARRRAPVSL